MRQLAVSSKGQNTISCCLWAWPAEQGPGSFGTGEEESTAAAGALVCAVTVGVEALAQRNINGRSFEDSKRLHAPFEQPVKHDRAILGQIQIGLGLELQSISHPLWHACSKGEIRRKSIVQLCPKFVYPIAVLCLAVKPFELFQTSALCVLRQMCQESTKTQQSLQLNVSLSFVWPRTLQSVTI